ncbi:MAG: hypothetical protein MHMPM18_000298 [Marteilia pararefringens]
MPMKLDDGWNQIQFNLSDFTQRAYGTNYVETLRVTIHANCRLRRLFFTDRLYSEQELPMEYKIYIPADRQELIAANRPSNQLPFLSNAEMLNTMPHGAITKDNGESTSIQQDHIMEASEALRSQELMMNQMNEETHHIGHAEQTQDVENKSEVKEENIEIKSEFPQIKQEPLIS